MTLQSCFFLLLTFFLGKCFRVRTENTQKALSVPIMVYGEVILTSHYQILSFAEMNEARRVPKRVG